MKYVFAGDRDIAVNVLDFLIQQGFNPSALMVSGNEKASHANELKGLSQLSDDLIMIGKSFENKENLEILKELQPDYIIGIHFPYIISKEVLNIPKVGFLNLHPAYLPYNRGWHTPSWAILEGTPVGATLHFMSEQLDGGDIINQKELEVLPNDTANSLYLRLKKLELEVFKESFPNIISLTPPRKSQKMLQGTSHSKKDLFKPTIQLIEMDKVYTGKAILNRLRALTTNSLDEAAYFIDKGKKYRIQIQIIEEKEK